MRTINFDDEFFRRLEELFDEFKIELDYDLDEQNQMLLYVGLQYNERFDCYDVLNTEDLN
jgi:hypothetical protein